MRNARRTTEARTGWSNEITIALSRATPEGRRSVAARRAVVAARVRNPARNGEARRRPSRSRAAVPTVTV